jgi:hypothetical protein
LDIKFNPSIFFTVGNFHSNLFNIKIDKFEQNSKTKKSSISFRIWISLSLVQRRSFLLGIYKNNSKRINCYIPAILSTIYQSKRFAGRVGHGYIFSWYSSILTLFHY